MGKVYRWRNRRLKGLEEFPGRDRKMALGGRRQSGGWREALPVLIPGLIIGVSAGLALSMDVPASAARRFFGVVSPVGNASLLKQPPAKRYYSGCNEVRAAGRAPLYKGEPGYREGMDGDGDGIACEPIPGDGGGRRRGRH